MVLVDTYFKRIQVSLVTYHSFIFISYRQQSGHIGQNVRKPVESLEIHKVEIDSLCLLCRLYY